MSSAKGNVQAGHRFGIFEINLFRRSLCKALAMPRKGKPAPLLRVKAGDRRSADYHLQQTMAVSKIESLSTLGWSSHYPASETRQSFGPVRAIGTPQRTHSLIISPSALRCALLFDLT